MRRAVTIFAVAVAAFASPAGARAAEIERAADVVDGTGLVDFSRRPNFTVGTWLKYRTSASSLLGHKDDYTVTVIVAGEEVFWGEPCVWIETWTQKAGEHPKQTASLLSYTAFGDTMANRHLMWFLRKTINGLTPQGVPDIALNARDGSDFQLRQANWDKAEDKVKIDSLGRGSTTVPAGTFDVVKVLRRQGHTETAEKGDSTIYYERRMLNTYHYSDQVPLTSLVKIDIDDVQQGKTWLAGRFDSSPLRVLERAQGSTALIDRGATGVTPSLVPEAARRTIDRHLIEQAVNTPSEPRVKVIRRRSGR